MTASTSTIASLACIVVLVGVVFILVAVLVVSSFGVALMTSFLCIGAGGTANVSLAFPPFSLTPIGSIASCTQKQVSIPSVIVAIAILLVVIVPLGSMLILIVGITMACRVAVAIVIVASLLVAGHGGRVAIDCLVRALLVTVSRLSRGTGDVRLLHSVSSRAEWLADSK